MKEWKGDIAAAGLLMLALAGIAAWWLHGMGPVRPPDQPAPGHTGSPRLPPGEGFGVRWVAASFGYASGIDPETGDYRLVPTVFDPETGAERDIDLDGHPARTALGSAWPKAAMSWQTGSVSHFGFILEIDGPDWAIERYRLRDRDTGTVLDAETRGWTGEGRWFYGSLYPKAVHRFGAHLEIELRRGETRQTVALQVAPVPGVPPGNEAVDDLFDVRIPCLVVDAYDLARFVEGAAQVRFACHLPDHPVRLEPVRYDDVILRDLLREVLIRDVAGGITFNQSTLEFHRRPTWQERWERLRRWGP